MILALICFASVAAASQLNATSSENQKPTQETRMEGDSRCSLQNDVKGVLYHTPPSNKVLETHKWLKFTIRTVQPEPTDGNRDEEEQSEVRLRIWPNPKDPELKENCETSDHEQELFGKMKQISTFVLSTRDYLDGVCMQVEIEDEHRRWNKDPSTECKQYVVSFKGNGDDTERAVAVAFAFVSYVGFSILFLQLWFCLLKTGRFMRNRNLQSAPDLYIRRHIVTHTHLDGINVFGRRLTMRDSVEYKSTLSWKILLTTSFLYLVPSLQFTLFAYYQFWDDGDQDRCFYNFRCLKPTGSLAMGNHLLSNIGYPILGCLFIKVVRMKELFELEKRKENDVRDKGVALDYGLFYTMGLTLAMIGVMSACYHICPTSINFQFDTTYMHLLAIFMYFSLFKSRHPDVAPDAIAAFSLLAFSVSLGVVSVQPFQLSFMGSTERRTTRAGDGLRKVDGE